MSTLVDARPASPVTGARPLLKVSLKHDGRLFAPWILVVTLLSATSVIVYPLVFPDQESRAALTAAITANPAMGLIFGPANDLSTVDGFNAWRTLALGGFLAAIGAIFAVTRATRAQEDSGQAELLASGVMGRNARLLTGVIIAVIGSVVLGVVASLVTVAFGGDWTVSLLLAATWTCMGLMFAGLSAVAVQIAPDARGANGISVGTLGALFLLTGFCYSVEAPSWTIWANPIGWMHETEPGGANLWWPLLLALGLFTALVTVAFGLQARRDFGQGLIKPGAGPARGKTLTTGRLAFRLSRGPFLTWLIAFVALGFVFGYFATSLPDLLASDSGIQNILAAGAVTPEEIRALFLKTILSLVGILASVTGVQVMLRVRSEEMEDRVDPIIAGAVARPRYYGSNVLVALAFPAVFVTVAGSLIGVLASQSELDVAFGDVFLQALATVPAAWTVVAFSALIVGERPKVALAAWAGVFLSFALTILGPTFGLDDWVLGISPFWHVPNVSAASPDWSGLGWISLFTLGFLAVGFRGFRHRDLAR